MTIITYIDAGLAGICTYLAIFFWKMGRRKTAVLYIALAALNLVTAIRNVI